MHLLLHYQMIINNTSPTPGHSHFEMTTFGVQWSWPMPSLPIYGALGHAHSATSDLSASWSLLHMVIYCPSSLIHMIHDTTMIISWYYIILWHVFSCLYSKLNAVRNGKQINDIYFYSLFNINGWQVMSTHKTFVQDECTAAQKYDLAPKVTHDIKLDIHLS